MRKAWLLAVAGVVAFGAFEVRGQSGAAAPQAIQVKLEEWDLGAKDFTVTAKTAVFNVENGGQFPHALAIEGSIGGQDFEIATPVLQKGQKTSLTVSLPAGTYTVYCPVGNHEDRGMKGTLTFKAP